MTTYVLVKALMLGRRQTWYALHIRKMHHPKRRYILHDVIVPRPPISAANRNRNGGGPKRLRGEQGGCSETRGDWLFEVSNWVLAFVLHNLTCKIVHRIVHVLHCAELHNTHTVKRSPSFVPSFVYMTPDQWLCSRCLSRLHSVMGVSYYLDTSCY
jgi:hypothetical protein